MKRILITGCSGFLGRHLGEYLGRREEGQVSGLTEEKGFESPWMKVHRCDIRDQEGLKDVLEHGKPDTVYHLAAIASVGRSWRHPLQTHEINFMGTVTLLEALRSAGFTGRVVLMGSAEVYGDRRDTIQSASKIEIRNHYALSKYAMELAGQLYNNRSEWTVIRVRSFNFTGPGQSRQFVTSDFAGQIAAIERGEGPPRIRVGNLAARRDFSDVRDVVRYLTEIGRRGRSGEPYNLCSGRVVSIKEILDTLLGFSSRSIEVVTDPDKFRPADIPFLRGDPRPVREEFGLSPRYSIRRTLRDCLDYWRDRGTS